MQTVISVFEDRDSAQRAVDRLLYEGFDADDVHLQEAVAQGNTAVGAAPGTADHEHGVLASIRHFFARTFDHEHSSSYPDRYSEAVRRGHPVVVVDAKDPDHAQRAYRIVHELGAFDIDERAAQWQEEERRRPGATSGRASDAAAAQPDQQERRSARIFQRRSGMPLRDLFRRHREQEAEAPAGAINRPASTEGESQLIDRSERERERDRAVAADAPREMPQRENDIEAREPKTNAPRRDV